MESWALSLGHPLVQESELTFKKQNPRKISLSEDVGISPLASGLIDFYWGRRAGAQDQSNLTQVTAAGDRSAGHMPITLTSEGVFRTWGIWKRNHFEKSYANISQICWSPQTTVFCLTSHWNLVFVFSGLSGSSAVKNLPTIHKTWICSLGQEDPLEKEMSSHFSNCVWETLWTEEPGGL